MKKISQRDLAEKIAILMGKENPSNVKTNNSVMSYISQIKKGERGLAKKWESPLLAALECDIDELRKEWPRMRFKGEKGLTSRSKKSREMKLNAEIIIRKSEAAILKNQDLPELLSVIKYLNILGFLMEVKIQPAEE